MADYAALTKYRLSFSVVFSAMAGYFIAPVAARFTDVILLVLGGFLVTGAANTFNQVIEKDRDALMRRTKDRPVAAGRMQPLEALLFATIIMIIGLGMLYKLNVMAAGFGALSIFLYACVYTPLKAKGPIAVFIGAFPGAIPYLLGWVAATNSFGIEPGTLFAIQFIWQFPHFWAIAWLGYDEYKKAGYYLLPTRKKDKTSAYLILVYTLWLVFISTVPHMGFTGDLHLSLYSLVPVLLLGFYILRFAWKMYRTPSHESAKKLMIASIVYLPLLQLIYMFDSIFIR